MRKSRKLTILKYTLRTVAVLVGLALVAVSAAVYLVFTPERITPIVMKYANEYMNAHLECERVELTFFSTFPDFGIRLQGGSVITEADSLSACPQDTLLTFRDFSISFNPIALYKKNRLIIHHARLERPVIYTYVSPEGKANWDILPTGDSASDSTSQLPAITLKSFEITDANIIYDDRSQAVFIATDSLQLSAKGTLVDVDLSLSVKAVTTLYDNRNYTSRLPFTLTTHLLSDEAYRQFTIDRTRLSVGILDFDMEGAVLRDTADGSVKTEISFGLHASSLAELLEAIPKHVLDTEHLTASGELDFSGSVNGYFGQDRYPACSVSLQVRDGAVVDRQHPGNPFIGKMEIDCDAAIDPTNGSPSYVRVNSIFLQNAAARLDVSGILDNIFTQPLVDAKIRSNIDFKRLIIDAPMTAEGSMTADVSGKFFLGDLLASNFGKVNLTGNVDIDNVKFNYPDGGIDLFAPLTKIRLGSNVVDSIRGREIASLFRATVEFDSLDFKWKDDLTLKAGSLTAVFRTSEPKDTVTITEVSAFTRLGNLQIETSDSMRLRAVKISALGKWAPSAKNPAIPEFTTRLSMDSVRGRMPDLAGRINNTTLEVKFLPRETRADRVRPPQTEEDSIRRKIRMDSLANAGRNSSVMAFRLEDEETRDFLSTWDISGTFDGERVSVRTPYFPLPARLSGVSATFTADRLAISGAQLNVGASDMRLRGEIEGIRRALLYNGRITANFDMETDSIDCNEIIRALAAGSAYSAKSGEQQDSISNIVLNETNSPQQAADTLSGLFVVPRNVELELNTSMKKLKYNKLNIDEATGKIIVRNRSIRIPGLKIKSDVGNMDLSMVYKAPTTKGAYMGVDVYMEKIRLKEFIRSVPMLDSLTPMMRSFEGMAECSIIAVTELDSLSNVIIPKTTASCYINGKNMVLLDGETFSTIAKKLYFKNKSRNVIDSISVEMALEDSKILVFPFVLSIDRYVAAVGGTQNLDMSFQYHISMLKWPVPLLKIGLNLWGNPDDIHYRMASRKYADLLTPVKEKSLESTVINMRQQLRESLRKSIDDILNESPEQLNRRPRIAIGNDSIASLFKLDSISTEGDGSLKPDSISTEPLPTADSLTVEEETEEDDSLKEEDGEQKKEDGEQKPENEGLKEEEGEQKPSNEDSPPEG